MTESIQVGDRVEIRLGEKFGDRAGWYPGRVFRIEPYSQHRRFYWVELDEIARASLGIRQISVLNPKNIKKVDSTD